MFDLKDKVALVTGATRGIGLGYVKELLQNEIKGVALVASNAITGQKALEEVTAAFGKERAIFIQCDVTDRAQLEAAFETTVKTFKQLDIVINNAGIAQEIHWEKCIAVNLTAAITGSMLAMEKYFPKYKSGPEAVILNTASMLGVNPSEEAPTYAATKCGLVGFTRAMGGDLHYKTTNVRIMAICAGFTTTGLENITEHQFKEPYLSLMREMIKTATFQTTEDLARNAIDLIKNGSTGSIWLAIDGKCTRIAFPTYT